MIYVGMILGYLLIMCCFGLAIAIKNEIACEYINDDEWWKIVLWPLAILFWFVTKIHNFVHKQRRK